MSDGPSTLGIPPSCQAFIITRWSEFRKPSTPCIVRKLFKPLNFMLIVSSKTTIIVESDRHQQNTLLSLGEVFLQIYVWLQASCPALSFWSICENNLKGETLSKGLCENLAITHHMDVRWQAPVDDMWLSSALSLYLRIGAIVYRWYSLFNWIYGVVDHAIIPQLPFNLWILISPTGIKKPVTGSLYNMRLNCQLSSELRDYGPIKLLFVLVLVWKELNMGSENLWRCWL